MKILHRVVQAPQSPNNLTHYGAVVRSMEVSGPDIVLNWAIYTNRKRRPRGRSKQAKS